MIDVDENEDTWLKSRQSFPVDGIHTNDDFSTSSALWKSEYIKIEKLKRLKEVIDTLAIDQAIIFVRTRLDADHLVKYLCSFNGTVWILPPHS